MSGQRHLSRDATTTPPASGAPAARRRPGPSRRARAALPLHAAGAGMLVCEVSVRAPEVVFVKGLVEASDGLASVFAERGGELLLATPHGREAELGELLADLERDIGARVGAPRSGGDAWDQDLQDR